MAGVILEKSSGSAMYCNFGTGVLGLFDFDFDFDFVFRLPFELVELLDLFDLFDLFDAGETPK